MKKIIPFKKQLFLDNTISEITSISLEHTLSYKKEFLISGDFIITGSYKTTDTSVDTLPFDFRVPCDINVDDKYDLSHVVIDIDDFYYEIIDNNAIDINIDVMLDKIEDRCIDKEDNFIVKTATKIDDVLENTQETLENIKEKKEEIDNKIEEKMDNVYEKIEKVQEKLKGFVTYRVCIVKEDETVEQIMDRYKVDKETLSLYNNLDNIQKGDKLIIPANE